MMRKCFYKSWILSLSAIVLLSMAGCGGGGSSDADTGNPISKPYSGVVRAGILVDSIVCIDANENGTCDEGEPSAKTDAQGKFTIAETTVTGSFLVSGGKDIGTGLSFTGALSAPAGSTVITPLTSAVQSLVESGKSEEEAEANVKAALGISSDVHLTTFDPFESANDANATVAAQAKAVMASQAHLQTIVHAVSVAVASADANQSTAGVMGSVFSQISQSFDGAITDVNLSVADVTAATKTVANDLYANNLVALVSVKNNAQTTAQSAVGAAEMTQESIEAGTPAEAQGNLNAGITLVNTSIAADINSSTAASREAADDLNATSLQAIVDAQAAQEAKEAEIAAAVAAAKAAAEAEAKAQADYTAALAAADLEAQKAAYDALLEAQAEELRQAEAERAARAAAKEAAALAAAQEAKLAADEALASSQAAAELARVKAQAKAEAAEAAARIAAAEAKAEAAKAEANLAEANLAAANAERNAAVNIMKVQAEALVANAYGYIPHVKESIKFIQSLNDNYGTDTIIGTNLSIANDALTNLGTYAGDTNASAQDLYNFAALVATGANVTDANVTDANSTLQFVISNEALASSQVAIAQTALDDTRARVLEIQAVVAVEHRGVAYGTVTSPYTGKVWLDRNLGASQVCTAYDDTECYGDDYLWGRDDGGIEDVYFDVALKYPYDWVDNDDDGSLRSANWSKTDGSSICPVGYRVPTLTELVAETSDTNYLHADNFLKLPSAGYRGRTSGVMSNQGSSGFVWSSSAKGSNSGILIFTSTSTTAIENYGDRTYGGSVRCLKD